MQQKAKNESEGNRSRHDVRDENRDARKAAPAKSTNSQKCADRGMESSRECDFIPLLVVADRAASP